MKKLKIGLQMSILMGVTLSFCLSLVGNLTSGHFSIIGFLLSFVVSTVISFVIGFIVPMRKISERFCKKRDIDPQGFRGKLIGALISDCIYTPVITVSMVTMAWKMASKHGDSAPPLVLMLIKSLLISMVVGYVLIFIFTPIFLRIVMKKNGVDGPPEKSGKKGKKDK